MPAPTGRQYNPNTGEYEDVYDDPTYGRVAKPGDPDYFDWNNPNTAPPAGSIAYNTYHSSLNPEFPNGGGPEGWQAASQTPTAVPETPPPSAPPPTPPIAGPTVTPTGNIPPAQAAPPAYPAPAPLSKVTLPKSDLKPYNPIDIPQWTPPDTSVEDQMQRTLLQQVLTNPLSFSDQAVGALKARQQEEAAVMSKQLQGQLRQGAASRGTLYGGQTGAGERRIGQDLISNILKGNRDVDIQKATQDQTDRRTALSSADQILGGITGRANTNQQTQLQRLGLVGSEAGKQYQSQADISQAALTQALAQFGADQDIDKFNESVRQFQADQQRLYGTANLSAYNNWISGQR